jgi:two-component system, OmpR family, response regulator
MPVTRTSAGAGGSIVADEQSLRDALSTALGLHGIAVDPVRLGAITADLRTILRPRLADPSARAASTGVLVVGDLVLEDSGHRVSRAGRAVELSPTEFRLLRYLMANADQVLAQRKILERVWGRRFHGDPSVVSTYIYSLRRKLDAPGEIPLIRTRHGLGYCLSSPEPPAQERPRCWAPGTSV